MSQIGQYGLFLFDDYEPLGGWDDFQAADNDPDELLPLAQDGTYDQYQLVDLHAGVILYQGRCEAVQNQTFVTHNHSQED